MNVCRLCTVQGRVQGVFFRASTQREALRLGLQGHAVNLANGGVEVLACGSSAAVEQLEAWLWEGPPGARVDSVVCHSVNLTPTPGFRAG